MIRHFILSALSLLALAAAAQDIDLNAQRHESRVVNPVPGRVLSAKERGHWPVYPAPREMTQSTNHHFAFAGDFNLKNVPAELHYAVPSLAGRKSFAADIILPKRILFKKADWLTPLKVEYGREAALKAGLPDHPEAYRILVDHTTKGIDIVASDFRGALHALQTLDQLVNSPEAKELNIIPFLEITDWPELPRRGIVEGFYGEPWSHATRLDLIRHLGRHKMNTYVYGPKDDPYHSSPSWRMPYPDAEAGAIRQLVAAADSAGVDFVWAIHPGQDIRRTREDYDSLLAKFNMMYDLGVRAFAIHFDDISGPGTNPAWQTEILNNLRHDFVEARGDVAPLIVCPTEYSRLWANPRPGGANDIYGRNLAKDIDIFYTGDAVCSDLTPSTLEFMDTLIRRPALFWWNFPVTDYCRNIILQGPVYGLDPTVTAATCAGILSNPMEHGIASKTALSQLAEYAWNPSAYNPLDAWTRALAETAGEEAAPFYRDFAINSADTRTGYRRDESWEMPAIPSVEDISASDRTTLDSLFHRLRQAPDSLRALCLDSRLTGELEPWLVEAEALGNRLIAALALTDSAMASASPAEQWDALLKALPSEAEAQAFEAHTLGTLRLMPFHAAATRLGASRLMTILTGRPAAFPDILGSYPDMSMASAAADGDTLTFFHSGQGQRRGDFIAIDLGEPTEITGIDFLQGRHEGDTDFFDEFTIEVSDDGSLWTPLTATPILNEYRYHWAGIPATARFVAIRRGDNSSRTNWLAVREFTVNPTTPEAKGLSASRPLSPAMLHALDRNPLSAVSLNGTIEYQLPAGAAKAVILSTEIARLNATWLDDNGREISSPIAITETLATLPRPSRKATRLRLSGAARIAEIL